VALPAANAAAFIADLQQLDNRPAWIIGDVLASSEPRSANTAALSPQPTIVPV